MVKFFLRKFLTTHGARLYDNARRAGPGGVSAWVSVTYAFYSFTATNIP